MLKFFTQLQNTVATGAEVTTPAGLVFVPDVVYRVRGGIVFRSGKWWEDDNDFIYTVTGDIVVTDSALYIRPSAGLASTKIVPLSGVEHEGVKEWRKERDELVRTGLYDQYIQSYINTAITDAFTRQTLQQHLRLVPAPPAPARNVAFMRERLAGVDESEPQTTAILALADDGGTSFTKKTPWTVRTSSVWRAHLSHFDYDISKACEAITEQDTHGVSYIDPEYVIRTSSASLTVLLAEVSQTFHPVQRK